MSTLHEKIKKIEHEKNAHCWHVLRRVLPPPNQIQQHWLRWGRRVLPSSQMGHKQSGDKKGEISLKLTVRNYYRNSPIWRFNQIAPGIKIIKIFLLGASRNIVLPQKTRQCFQPGGKRLRAGKHTRLRQTEQKALESGQKTPRKSTKWYTFFAGRFIYFLKFLTVLVAGLPERSPLWEHNGNNEILEAGDVEETGVLKVPNVVFVHLRLIVVRFIHVWWPVANTG